MRQVIRAFFCVALLLSLVSCWDNDHSPEIINDTNQDYELFVISNDKTQRYKIESGDSLLLPNILVENGFLSLKLINPAKNEIILFKNELIAFIKGNNGNQFSLEKIIAEHGKTNGI